MLTRAEYRREISSLSLKLAIQLCDLEWNPLCAEDGIQKLQDSLDMGTRSGWQNSSSTAVASLRSSSKANLRLT